MYRRVHFARFVGPRRGRRRRRGRPRRGSHRLARRARWLDRGDLHRRAVRGGEHAVRARFQRHGSRRSRCVYFYVRIGNWIDVVFCVQAKWTGYRASFTTLPRMPTRGARTPRSGRRMPRVGEFFLLFLVRAIRLTSCFVQHSQGRKHKQVAHAVRGVVQSRERLERHRQ